MTYSDKLKDPRWQRKRLEVLQRDDFTCLACGAKDKQLHVHHCYYVSGREPWEYPGASLLTLCKSCHDSVGDRNHPVWGLVNEWEASAELENRRIIFNLKAYGTLDVSILSGIYLAHHSQESPVPIEEWMNALADGFRSGLINDQSLGVFRSKAAAIFDAKFNQKTQEVEP